MQLTFLHDCMPADGTVGCPVAGRETIVPSTLNRINEFTVPDVRCQHTRFPLKLVAVDGNRDI